MSVRSRWLIGLLAAGLIMSSAVAVPSARASDEPALCALARGSAAWLGADLSALASDRIVVMRGEAVDLRAAAWRWDGPDAVTRLYFHGAGWLAVHAQSNPVDAVNLALEQARVRPDPGASATAKDYINTSGWNEAMVTIRMQTIQCLYQLSGDARLVPVMEALVRANLDPMRYYGPPRFKFHNHGLMANRALLRAAVAFGRPEWAESAGQRLAAGVPGYLDECGMTFEQSATYQHFSVRLLTAMAEQSGSSIVALAAQRAAVAAAALTRPDGSVPVIGNDSGFGTGQPSGQSLWCPRSGWAVHSGPRDQVPQHAVVRFGPPRTMHGHQDKGAFTWWVGGADGVAVLDDPGIFSKVRGQRFDWAQSQAAHSVLERVGDPFTGAMSGAVSRVASGSRFDLSARKLPYRYTRTIEFSATSPRVVVLDRVTAPSSASAHRYLQRWTLAPGWMRVTDASAPDVIARRADGHSLSVVCRVGGRPITPQVRDIEFYPSQETVISSLQVVCPVPPRRVLAMRTDLTVIPPPPAELTIAPL